MLKIYEFSLTEEQRTALQVLAIANQRIAREDGFATRDEMRCLLDDPFCNEDHVKGALKGLDVQPERRYVVVVGSRRDYEDYLGCAWLQSDGATYRSTESAVSAIRKFRGMPAERLIKSMERMHPGLNGLLADKEMACSLDDLVSKDAYNEHAAGVDVVHVFEGEVYRNGHFFWELEESE